MVEKMSRRMAIGMGAAAAAGVGLAPHLVTSTPAHAAAQAKGAEDAAATKIRDVHRKEARRAGGSWHTLVTMTDAAGAWGTVIDDGADVVTNGYSVQKLAVATALLHKVDTGELKLDDKIQLTADDLRPGSGIYQHQTVYGDQLTVAGFLTALLLVSDNTAVRLSGRTVKGPVINEILAAKGFAKTRVEPLADKPERFYLGTTTAREMHDLLSRLANKTLLTPASCDFMLGIMRGLSGYHDGVRRNMSSSERSRVATKYGAESNSLGASRHEVGIMFGLDGSPALIYSMLATGLSDTGNYGATHPGVQAHAELGRVMFNAIAGRTAPKAKAKAQQAVPQFRPGNGG